MKQVFNIFRRNNFRLEKLYCDSVDDSGNCFIIYLAKLDYRIISISYSGFIFIDESGFKIENSDFKKTNIPVAEKLLTIKINKLGIEGSWKSTDAPFALSLFKNEDNEKLIWNCHHPKSITEIRYNNKIFRGKGYAETLILPNLPYRLPVEEIRWGRFLSDTATVIWISWKGEKPLNRLFLNGTEYNDAEFSRDRITFGEKLFRLSFSQVRIIREGTIADLFSGKYVLKTVIGQKILRTSEIKYIANTTFSRNSIFVAKGWSIFESVVWKK